MQLTDNPGYQLDALNLGISRIETELVTMRCEMIGHRITLLTQDLVLADLEWDLRKGLRDLKDAE
jgi:hypothetical protein